MILQIQKKCPECKINFNASTYLGARIEMTIYERDEIKIGCEFICRDCLKKGFVFEVPSEASRKALKDIEGKG